MDIYLQKQVFSREFGTKDVYTLNLGNSIKGQIILLICPTLYIMCGLTFVLILCFLRFFAHPFEVENYLYLMTAVWTLHFIRVVE